MFSMIYHKTEVWFISINLKSGSGSEVWSLTESLTSSSNIDTCFFFEVAAGHFQGKASSLKVHQISTPVNVTQRLTGCHGGEAQCGANRGCVYRVITRKGCGQADTWASSQGAMFESVLKASCEIIDYGWTKDRAPVDTFIMGLATSIRERNDYEEEVRASQLHQILVKFGSVAGGCFISSCRCFKPTISDGKFDLSRLLTAEGQSMQVMRRYGVEEPYENLDMVSQMIPIERQHTNRSKPQSDTEQQINKNDQNQTPTQPTRRSIETTTERRRKSKPKYTNGQTKRHPSN
ncbi:hypothetical protein L2E82_04201 [Cichorium intybus]|uniref:Uncharacterized protein n=1 Tax=Cichorium intybus TaxID=13427 RepID=A0ACB9H663_CICIN|nr:hypothetical protein L2E82_04201 [Cichorium intybus]